RPERTDPDRPPPELLEAYRRELDAGGLNLLDETGRPRWSRWRAGKGDVAKDLQNPFTVDTWAPGLLELLPEPGRDGFRFQGEVQLKSQSVTGKAGIYLAHRVVPSPQGPEHWFWALTVKRQGDTKRVKFMLHCYRDPEATPQDRNSTIVGIDYPLP